MSQSTEFQRSHQYIVRMTDILWYSYLSMRIVPPESLQWATRGKTLVAAPAPLPPVLPPNRSMQASSGRLRVVLIIFWWWLSNDSCMVGYHGAVSTSYERSYKCVARMSHRLALCCFATSPIYVLDLVHVQPNFLCKQIKERLLESFAVVSHEYEYKRGYIVFCEIKSV